MIDSTRLQTDPAAVPSRLPSLTGMRFLAAIMVFLFHGTSENLFTSQVAQRNYTSVLNQGGVAGVSFFFVLSGFVLAWTAGARPGDSARAFWRRRTLKIFPNHVLTFVAALVLLIWVADRSVGKGTSLLHLLLIQSWFPQFDVRINLNDVAWSLSCEAFFYLMFPFLMAIIGRIRPERLWAWAGGVTVAAVIVVPMAADRLMAHGMVWPGVRLTGSQFFFLIQFPPVRLLDFVFGMILARIVLSGRRLPLGFGGSVALVVAAYFLAPLFPPVFSVIAVTFVPLGLLVAAAATDDVRQRRSWLSSRTMIWLGELSFAFYLWHRLVMVYGHHLLGGKLPASPWLSQEKSWETPTAIAVLALMFAVTLMLSWLTFSLLERPLMRRFATSRRRPGRAAEPRPVVEPPAPAGPATSKATAAAATPTTAGTPTAAAATTSPD